METTDVFIENYIFFSLGINYLDFLNMWVYFSPPKNNVIFIFHEYYLILIFISKFGMRFKIFWKVRLSFVLHSVTPLPIPSYLYRRRRRNSVLTLQRKKKSIAHMRQYFKEEAVNCSSCSCSANQGPRTSDVSLFANQRSRASAVPSPALGLSSRVAWKVLSRGSW